LQCAHTRSSHKWNAAKNAQKIENNPSPPIFRFLAKVLIVTLYVKVYFIRCIKNAMPGMSRAWRYGLQPGFDLIFCADSGWIFSGG
jgi:hypothetical protein